MKAIKPILSSALENSVSLREQLLRDPLFADVFEKACEVMLATRISGGTIYVCGNGGSACDAIHFVEELVARYSKERPGIKAQHFMDPGVVTCWCNDYNYETVFSRQVETFCTSKDVLVALSTSGNSKNILNALKASKQTKTPSILLSGRDGGEAKSISDLPLVVPHDRTDRIQEVHITLLHAFCEFLEQDL